MLSKKEIKEMVKSELGNMVASSQINYLQKYVESDRQKMLEMLNVMIKVYNYQHSNRLFNDNIIREVLQENEEIYNGLSEWYNIQGHYTLALHLS